MPSRRNRVTGQWASRRAADVDLHLHLERGVQAGFVLPLVVSVSSALLYEDEAERSDRLIDRLVDDVRISR